MAIPKDTGLMVKPILVGKKGLQHDVPGKKSTGKDALTLICHILWPRDRAWNRGQAAGSMEWP